MDATQAIGTYALGMPGGAFSPEVVPEELDGGGLEFTLPDRLMHFTLVEDDA